MRLYGKLILKGQINLKTGLSIGGSDEDVQIGGIDNSVIKNSQGQPYIPGSSLKGKLRSLLELSMFDIIENKNRNNMCECGKKTCPICTIFGASADHREEDLGPTRIIVRDAFLTNETIRQMENREGIFSDLDLIYTEGKWENSINRLTSKAMPRQLEKVPAGAKFDFEMAYNILRETDINYINVLFKTLKMLEDDYLGGNGSRGYGKINFENIDLVLKSVRYYREEEEAFKETIDSLADYMWNESRMNQKITELLEV